MIKTIKELLFSGRKIKHLEEQLKECSVKLAEKQEHINTTNAYWKKKLHEEKIKKSGKKPAVKKDL